MPSRRPDVSTKAVIASYDRTRSIDKTATELILNRSTVAYRLRKAGIKRQGPKRIDPNRPKKKCHRCERPKRVEEFNKCRSRSDGRSATCRKCWAEYQAERTLALKFGISFAEFHELLKAQGGGCGICGTKAGMKRAGRRLRLCVDHDHKTNRLRGILCNSCNNGLGRFKDDPALLVKAAQYLQR